MHMADPSKSTAAEVPDFIVEVRKKDAKRKRMKLRFCREKRKRSHNYGWL
jgi:Uma2 family endonuclease